MSNLNITQRGIQATGLSVMIGRCSPNSQLERPRRHPANAGCSFFRYTNDNLRNHTNQRPKRKAWTREDNQLALHCYFWSNPTQRGYRKRMIEIWQECSNFQTKKGWFSGLEIIEIYQRVNSQQCLTHQILTNKNSPTEMNHQLRKMETPHNQSIQN